MIKEMEQKSKKSDEDIVDELGEIDPEIFEDIIDDEDDEEDQ